jgi:hypothetical protein
MLGNSLIFEISSVCKKPSDLTILQESYDKTTKTGKLKFKTILQTADEINANKRYYSKKICNEIVSSLKPQSESRSLLQEIDHPFISSSDDNIQKSRASRIELNNCGSLISNIKIDGNNIVAECETLSSFKGPDLYNLIVKDKANIGFSVRMFGTLRKHPSLTEAIEVVSPVRVVTYDVVTNPSHKNARILQFLSESFSEFDAGSNIITESISYGLKNEKINEPKSSNNIVNEYVMMLLIEAFNNIKQLEF